MGFKLENIVPWGRNLSEYCEFFRLTKEDLSKPILSCADGPASFNAELSRIGGSCVSVDPIYEFASEQIKQRIDETANEIYNQLLIHQTDYNWELYGSPENLLKIRLDAMDTFLKDYQTGDAHHRYQYGVLPDLKSFSGDFDLVLCSHFLFTYSEHLSSEFHIESIKQMLSKGNEIRIFPICQIDGRPSVHLEKVVAYLKQENYRYCQVKVNFEFQKGGDTMLRIFNKK
jgi:hypothetical protein